MQYVVAAVVLLVIASLLLEKNPAGGFRISRRMTLINEFWYFIRERKLWWMTPIFVILGLLGVFIVMAEKSIVLPWIYTLW